MMDDEAGFDSFTKTYFITKQHAWLLAKANIMGNIKLMRNATKTWAH